MASRSCPLCGTDNHAAPVLHRRDNWEIKGCLCGMVYLENPPPAQELEEHLLRGRHASAESHPQADRRETGEPGLDKLQSLIRRYFRPGNVVDVGCANGRLLAKLGAQYTPFGIEISRLLAPIADDAIRERGGWVVQGAAVDGFAMFGGEHFTGIIMDSFLEHELQPRQLLEQCAMHLVAGGKVIIRVPNYASVNRLLHGERWRGLSYPDHMNYFTPTTLARMCREAGLFIDRFFWRDRFPFFDDMWLVAGLPD